MSYRLYAAIVPNPDPIVAVAEQGILSFLELWIGVIVACMPTVAPIFVAYVFPFVNKISSKMSGTSTSNSSNSNFRPWRLGIGGTDRAAYTIGGSGPDGRLKRKVYSEIDGTTLTLSTSRGDEEQGDSAAHRAEASGELRLVDPRDNARLRTDCATAPDGTPPSRDGIYVQQQFHTQERSV